jgi:hypothetical protein
MERTRAGGMRDFLSRVFFAQTEPPDGRLLAYFAILAFFAGGVRAVLRRSEKTTWLSILAAAAASAIAGFIVGSLCMWGKVNVYLALPMAGTAGWIGVWLMDAAGEWAKKLVQLKLEERMRE